MGFVELKMKRHPKTKEILAAMDKWAKKKRWPTNSFPNKLYTPLNMHRDFEEILGENLWGPDEYAGNYLYNEVRNKKGWSYRATVLHFISTGCGKGACYAYCARPGAGKVTKHKIGNCPLAKN